MAIQKNMGFFLRYKLLIVIFILALVLRVSGVYPGYPDNHPDEILGYGTAIHMMYNNLVPDSFDYGAGRPFLLLVIFNILVLPFVYFNLFFTDTPSFLNLLLHGIHYFTEYQYQELLFGHRMINAMYWARYIGAVLGALTVPLIFITAKKLFNEKTALFASFFLAINYRHVLSSTIGLPDVFNGFFSALALLSAVLLLKDNSRKNYFLSAIACAFAFSIKYQFFPLLPFIFVHLIWAYKKKNFLYLFNKNFIYSLLIFVSIFFILNPFLFSNLPQFIKESRSNYLRYQMGSLHFRPYGYFYLFHWGVGELPFIAIVLGILLMAKKSFLRFLLLMSFVASFFFAITIYSNGGIYTRNFSTVIPSLCIFAGYAINFIYNFFKKVRFSGLIIILLLLLVGFSQIRNSTILSYYNSKTWTPNILMDWMDHYLPSNITLRNYLLNLSWNNRDQFADIIKSKNIKQLDWDYSEGGNSLREFQDEKTDFAIVGDRNFQNITYWWRGWPLDLLARYSGVPYDYLQNGFYGLSIAELRNYTVGEVYRSWQSTADNYLIFKIPVNAEKIGKKIEEFNFDDKSQMWSVRGLFGLAPAQFRYSGNEGIEQSGSIVVDGGGQGDTSRLGSLPISITSSKYYTVRGWIKNSPAIKTSKRDGFLRIDFYKDKDKLDILGERVAISERAFLTGEWQQVRASAEAPNDAKYMTISFQRENQTEDFASYLDDVELFQSDELPTETFKKLPYIKAIMPVEDLYRNSFL